MHLRRWGCIAAAAMVLVASAPARADDKDPSEETPIGGIKFAGGLRQGLGELGDAFDLGYFAGLEANYHPSALLGRNFALGLAWSVYFGRFGAGDRAVLDETLKLVEMSFGLRARRRMGDQELRFLTLGAGVTIMRTNLPVPPNLERLNAGPYIGVGIEGHYKKDSMLSFEVRYGLLTNGPASLSLVFGIAFVAR